jgi:transcriptional regulator with XRE-family HTH domain
MGVKGHKVSPLRVGQLDSATARTEPHKLTLASPPAIKKVSWRAPLEGQNGALESIPAFGRLMRFWRGVFDVSQGELAEKLNVSLKHVSYLETGRSRPSEALIARIGHVFRLGPRDQQNLLIAANYFAAPPSEGRLRVDRSEKEALICTLRSLDPFPASIIDPYGNVHMVNRAWVHVWGKMLGDCINANDLNTYKLFFMEGGWRTRTVNWEDVASWLLLVLQQEVLLHNDPQAEQLIRDCQNLSFVPRDWAQRAIQAPASAYYPTAVRMEGGEVRNYLIVTHSVGAYPFSLGGRLWISIVYPKDFRPDVSLNDLAAAQLKHAKLPY